MKLTAPEYHAWLLRMWREAPFAPWRFALEDVSTGERQGFADFEALRAFLQTVYADDAWDSPTAAEKRI